jgi:thiosulfate dehydrogenase [quinone] small subunit
MNRQDAIALALSLLVAAFILGTGQWAYGNLYGPLHNYSKKPEVHIVAVTATSNGTLTYITLNLTDVNGPDAYQTSVPLMVVSNTTYTVTLNSTEIYSHTLSVVQAPWNLNKKDGLSRVGGFELWLGAEASYTLWVPRLSAGQYSVSLYVPQVPPVTANFTVV